MKLIFNGTFSLLMILALGCGGGTEPTITDQQGLDDLVRQMEEGREAEAAAAEEAAKNPY